MAENGDEGLGAIGFMFDSMHERFQKDIVIQTSYREFYVTMTLIGEDPGHRQSGHYLWPAAQFLASYLAENWNKYSSSLVVELGSGIGLCGIVTSQLGDRTQQVVLTDYDPGCLELLNINIINNSCKINSRTQFLEWGGDIHEVVKDQRGDAILLIGSDLLYCTEVVRPLFQSVSQLLTYQQSIKGQFLLASSFDVGQVTPCCYFVKSHRMSTMK